MNQSRRKFVFLSIMAAMAVRPGRFVYGLDTKRSDRFLPEERRAIEDYYRSINDKKKPKTKGLPPGLAKRGGKLPPGTNPASVDFCKKHAAEIEALPKLKNSRCDDEDAEDDRPE